MKKTLVALAALAATASFAQSSVGIVGVFDIGFKANSSPNTGSTTTSTQAVSSNGTATSALKFIGTEDLGGGMKASFLAEFNPNVVQSTTANQANAFASEFTGTPFNGEQYVGISGGFGDVKLGVPNAGFFLTLNASNPYGTAMGSAYGAGGVSRLGTVAPGIVSGVNSGTARIIRHERTVQYTTPSFNGLTATIGYAAQNDNSSTAGANQDGYTDISIRYSNGPLNIGFSNAVLKIGNVDVAGIGQAYLGNSGTGAVTGTLAAAAPVLGKGTNGDYTFNVLAGNYNMGATTIYAGYTTTKSNGSVTAEDSNSYNVAAKYTMGMIDLSGNYTVRQSNLTTVNNARVIGLGADYNLSKRTAVYYRFEAADNNTDGKATSATIAAGSVTNASMVGLRHSF
jgi:predicted porin